jgi:hypothetical protein
MDQEETAKNETAKNETKGVSGPLERRRPGVKASVTSFPFVTLAFSQALSPAQAFSGALVQPIVQSGRFHFSRDVGVHDPVGGY